jgi:hypothetical protein
MSSRWKTSRGQPEVLLHVLLELGGAVLARQRAEHLDERDTFLVQIAAQDGGLVLRQRQQQDPEEQLHHHGGNPRPDRWLDGSGKRKCNPRPRDTSWQL